MTLEQYFPNLKPAGYTVTSPATGDYNCIAYAAPVETLFASVRSGALRPARIVPRPSEAWEAARGRFAGRLPWRWNGSKGSLSSATIYC